LKNISTARFPEVGKEEKRNPEGGEVLEKTYKEGAKRREKRTK
jgi:hypothetical protein